MFDIVLYRPEIPPNTGNVIRLAANTGCALHLIEPLGFDLDDAKLRRAGLDYREYAAVRVHPDYASYRDAVRPARCWIFATAGTLRHDAVRYAPGDALVFGPESSGFGDAELATLPCEAVLRLPMRPGNRSLNLSNAVAVTVFEAWRQHGWQGGA